MSARDAGHLRRGAGAALVALVLDDEEALELLADVMAERLDARRPPAPSVWLDVDEAAEYLRCSGSTQRARRQRVYDLVHQGRLMPGRDGTRLLFRRDVLDAYLEGRVTAPDEVVEGQAA